MRISRNRILLLALVPLMAFALIACGPALPPEEIEGATAEAKLATDEAKAAETEEARAAAEETESEEETAAAGETEGSDSAVGISFDILGGASEEDVITTASGLRYIVSEEGDGPQPQAGDVVSVHYSGYLEDGTKFDSSVDRGQPFSLILGEGQVIPGWDEGIALLNVGSKGRLIIPAELGYGDAGAGGLIPPGATLVFDVELLEIREGPPDDPTVVDEADYTVTDSGLKYYDLEVGGGPSPEAGQVAVIHFTGWLEDGTRFDSTLARGEPARYPLGSEQGVAGLDEALQTMKVGGIRQMIIPPELGFGAEGVPGLIPPGATVIFEMELVDIE